MPWSPPEQDAAVLEALHEGVPPWMAHPFKAWFLRQLEGINHYGRSYWKTHLAQTFDSRTRRSSPLTPGFERHGPGWLYEQLTDNERLHFTDLLVFDNSEHGGGGYNTLLEKILLEGGSAHRVGTRDGEVGLERRVPLGVQEAAETVMHGAGAAGRLLSEAWHVAFGQNPDPEKAYAKAVLAVEAAITPVVLPNDMDRRLGKAVQQMRTDGDWRPAFEREHEYAPTSDVLIAMVRTLQSGQSGRHAGQVGSFPPSQASAEAAVVLAVPLVQWFTSGQVRRRPPTP